MAFKGITFAGQNVTPKNDGGLYQAHHGDGILWGCSMNISGDDLVIQSGEFIMGGRVVQVDGATNVDLSGRTLQTGYIQVIMNADLTQGEGNQWYTTFVESATTTFPALTKDDINDTGTLYQYQLAIVQISGGNLTSIYSSLAPSFITSRQVLLQGTTNNNPHLDFYDVNGKIVGSLWEQQSSGDFRLYGYKTDGATVSSGLYMEQGCRLIAFANGNNIIFRPNGAFDSTGQVQITTSGQQLGGHPLSTASNTTSRSLPDTNTNVLLNSITKPAGATYGIATGRVNLTLTAAGTVRLTLGEATCDCYSQDQYNRWFSITGIVNNANAEFYVRSNYKSGTIQSSYLSVNWF